MLAVSELGKENPWLVWQKANCVTPFPLSPCLSSPAHPLNERFSSTSLPSILSANPWSMAEKLAVRLSSVSRSLGKIAKRDFVIYGIPQHVAGTIRPVRVSMRSLEYSSLFCHIFI